MTFIKLQGKNPRFPVWVNPDHVIHFYVQHTHNRQTDEFEPGSTIVYDTGHRRDVYDSPEEIMKLVRDAETEYYHDPQD